MRETEYNGRRFGCFTAGDVKRSRSILTHGGSLTQATNNFKPQNKIRNIPDKFMTTTAHEYHSRRMRKQIYSLDGQLLGTRAGRSSTSKNHLQGHILGYT